MTRFVCAALMVLAVMVGTARPAEAADCQVSISGHMRDAFNNVVWNQGDFINLGSRSDSFECRDDGYNELVDYVYYLCQVRGSAVGIYYAADIYFGGSYVTGYYSPGSCRSDFGLNYYNTLAGDERLNPTDSLSSPNNSYHLDYQSDANLVVYSGSTAVWAINCWPTCTNIGGAGYAIMQLDGNFVVYSDTNTPVWDTGTFSNGAFLAIRNSGQLVVYSASGYVLWSN